MNTSVCSTHRGYDDRKAMFLNALWHAYIFDIYCASVANMQMGFEYHVANRKFTYTS